MKLTNRLLSAGIIALAACASTSISASAGELDATPPDGKETKKVVETKPPEPRFKLYGWIEGGFTGNTNAPDDRTNFGHLFTDRANEPMLNQVVLTAERALDTSATGFDWGFKVQFMYGTDARYIHSLGLLDLTTRDIVQPDLVEAYGNLHFPILSPGGVDLKFGKFVTLEGAETIDPRTNVFYSHTYIFNYGIPFNNTGAQATWHATKWLDIYAGINRGVNTSIDDNNNSVAFEGGIGLNLLDGNLTILGVTHAGPEDPHDNHDWRYLNDVTATWKITKALTSITDLNYIYDSIGNGQNGYGVAQYLTYAINDWLIAGVRAEFWRDEEGFFVAQFASQNDFIHIERGDSFTPDVRTVGGGRTTYGALTAGVTIKPPVPKPLAGLMIRPEVRWDHAFTNTHPFIDSQKRDQVTIGLDAIIQF
jgi:putative OmpL-like beta-barrel porin-2